MHDAASFASPESSAAFFRSLEVLRTQALVNRDIATMEELHSPDYQLITPSGKVLTRETYFDAIKAGPFYTEWTVDELRCRSAEAMAVVRYKAFLRFPSGGSLLCWHTDSYERGSLGWRAVWSQATEIRQPHQRR